MRNFRNFRTRTLVRHSGQIVVAFYTAQTLMHFFSIESSKFIREIGFLNCHEAEEIHYVKVVT